MTELRTYFKLLDLLAFLCGPKDLPYPSFLTADSPEAGDSVTHSWRQVVSHQLGCSSS
jgi:hypothetical protein